MTWTYSGDPSKSAKDQVRFFLGDTDTCDQLLQDGEISYLLGLYNQAPINAAIRGCEMIMAKFSRLANESVGRVSIQCSQKAKAYREMKADLVIRMSIEGATPFAGGISQAQVQTTAANTDRVRPSFTRHLFDNPQAAPWIGNPQGGWWFGGGWGE